MTYKDYKDLIVWQKGIELVKSIYEIVNCFPKEDIYALSSQMRRSAISIPSNIAEGYKRNSDKDFIHFLTIANGSLAELETQLIIAIELKMISIEQAKPAIDLCREVGKMLNSFINTLKQR